MVALLCALWSVYKTMDVRESPGREYIPGTRLVDIDRGRGVPRTVAFDDPSLHDGSYLHTTLPPGTRPGDRMVLLGGGGVRVERMSAARLLALGMRIHLNTATAQDLMHIPGIGPEKAARIVSFRERLGGYESLAELAGVNGIGKETVLALDGYLSLDEPR